MSSSKRKRPVGETLERLVHLLQDARYELAGERNRIDCARLTTRIDQELADLGLERVLEWRRRRDTAVGEEEHAAAVDGAELLIVRVGRSWCLQIAIPEIELVGAQDAAQAKALAVPKAQALMRALAARLK